MITTKLISKWLLYLTFLFHIVFFASLGWMFYTVANLGGKYMLDDPGVRLKVDIQTGLNLSSVAVLIILYFCRFVRWRNQRKPN